MATGKSLYGDETCTSHRHDDELRDPITDRDRIRHRAVGIQKGHADLSAVAGIHGSRRIDDRDAVFRRKPRPRYDECRKAVGKRDGYTRADGSPLTGLESDGLARGEIGSRVAGVGVYGRSLRRNEYVNGIGHVTRVVQNIGARESLVE